MAKILDMLRNSDKYKSVDEIQAIVDTSIKEYARNNTFQSNASLYSELDRLEAEKKVSNAIADMTRTADLVQKSEMIISGQVNGYLSGHTGNPILNSWMKALSSIDDEVASIMLEIRAKARDLCKNTGIMHRYVTMGVNNMVGSGFIYDTEILDDKGMRDIDLSNFIYQNFKSFTKIGTFDVSKRLSLEALERMHFYDLPQDGEVLVRKVKIKGINKFNFAVQALDIDRLDYTVNKSFSNGTAIVMGIEVNKYGMPINYYLKDSFDGKTHTHEIVPADEIMHLFIQEYPEQRRAVSWMHAVMLEVKQYAAFKEAVLFASRFGASTYASIERDPSSTADYANGRDKNGQLYRNIDKGQIVMLNPGEKLNSYTPPFPNNAIDPMLKSYERSIATGVGASFATLTSDYSESNFSSSRLGVNEERQDWKTKQQWYISTFLEPLFSDWLETCLINGTLVYKGKKLTINDFPRLNNIQFKGIKLPLIDPLKDVNTIAKEISIGTKSIPQAIEELHGTDVDTVFRHHKYAFDLANKLGIPIELYMKYALNQSVIEKNEAQAESPQEDSQDIKQQQANRSLATDIESQMVALAKAMKQETVPVTITNVIRSPGYKTIKTPILDKDGLIVKVIEEDVPCDTETNIEDNKEQL